MRKTILLMLTLVLLSFASLTARTSTGTLPVGVVPADALWVVHLDMAQFRQTRLSDLVKGDRVTFLSLANQWMKAHSRIDLVNDTEAITFYGMPGDHENVLVCLKGVFDKAFLISQLKQLDGYRKSDRDNLVVHRWEDSQFCVFMNDRLLVYSIHSLSEDALEQVLKTLEGKRAHLGNSAMATHFERMPKNAYLRAVVEDISALGHDNEAAGILGRSGLAIFVVMESDDNIQAGLTLTTDDEETALNIDQMVNGFIALGRLKRDAEAEDMAFLNGIRVFRKGRNLQIKLIYPVQDLMDRIEKHHGGLPFQKKQRP